MVQRSVNSIFQTPLARAIWLRVTYSNSWVSLRRAPVEVYTWRNNRVASTRDRLTASCVGGGFALYPAGANQLHLVGASVQVNQCTKLGERTSLSGHHAYFPPTPRVLGFYGSPSEKILNIGRKSTLRPTKPLSEPPRFGARQLRFDQHSILTSKLQPQPYWPGDNVGARP